MCARIAALLCATLIAIPFSTALAQKSADTLRVAYSSPISTVEVIVDPSPETIITNGAVFDGLVWYDPQSHEYKPALAESWTRLDDKTIEFKLRHGVKFHDGSDFTADDVVYTYNWIISPAAKLRYNNLSFVDHVEKIDAYTVRLYEKQPTSYDLARLNADAPIYPAAIHSKLENKSDFGRQHPIGTGPYKVVSIDATNGIVLKRNENYALASRWRPAASVETIRIVPMPDLQTQLAQLMTGGIDLIHDVPKDMVDQLAAIPNLKETASTGPNYFYMEMDSVNRSGNAALSNPKVRRALEMAIDRKDLAEHIVTGGREVKILNALCIESQADCPRQLDILPPEPNPAQAKALLAEAGYPNGIDVDITSIPGAQAMAEAVSGELRKIGVRAKVSHLTFGAYREKETTGHLEILVAHFWSPGASPIGTLERFFTSPARDYFHDQAIVDLKKKADGEIDQTKRVALYRDIFNRVNEQAYLMPLTTFPCVFAHSADLVVETGALNPGGIDLDRIHWNP